MEYKYFIEFLGTIVLVFAHFLTHANPYAMGIATFAVYTIGSSAHAEHFSPLMTTVSYLLGRLPQTETMYIIVSQFIAAFLVFVTFKGFHGLNID